MSIGKKQYVENILLVLRSPQSLLGGIIAGFIVGVLGRCFMDFDLIIGNQGHTIAYTEFILFLVFVVLFGLFVSISIYKVLYFRSGDVTQIGLGGVGGFLSLLVVGCPACSITFASYIGLASMLSLLPYNGLELKVIGIFFLLYSCFASLRTLQTCILQEKTGSGYDIQYLIRLGVIFLGFLICIRALLD